MSKSQEKVRVYALAKELQLDSKDVLDLCRELGYEGIKNQLSGLEVDQVQSLKKRHKDGPSHGKSANTAHVGGAAPAAPPKLETKVRTLPPPKPKPPTKAPSSPPAPTSKPAAEVKPTPAAVEATPATPEPVAEVKPAVVAPEPKSDVQPTPTEEKLVKTEVAPIVAETPNPPTTEPSAPAAVTPSPTLDPTVAVEKPKEVPSEPTAPTPTSPPPSSYNPSGGMPMGGRSVPNLANTGRPRLLGAGGRQPTHTPNQRQNAASGPTVPTRTSSAGSSTTNADSVDPNSGPTTPTAPGASSTGHPAPRANYQFQPPNPNAPRGNVGQPRTGASGRPIPGSGRPAGANPSRPNTGGRPQDRRGPMPPEPAQPNKGQVKLTPDQIKKLREMEQKRGQKLTMDQVTKQVATDADPTVIPPPDKGGPVRPDRPARAPARPGEESESDDDRKKKAPGEVAGRAGRHAQRQGRDKRGSTDKGAVVIGAGGQVETIEQKFGSQRGPRAALLRKQQRRKNQPIKIEGKIEIALPVTVRTLSETIGMKAGELILKLKNLTNSLYTINSNIDFDVAEMIAIEKSVELIAKKQDTAEDILLAGFKRRAEEVDPELLRPRPPIVTIMGHVDHGKTTLLDRIREEFGMLSDVVSTEAGGITQVLRAWRVEKDGKPVTFLDTPGHEAFTKMRARGAKVTDIAVIVVAATDGVMPQTEEAISHAQAAEVDLIIAINKVDMPNANLDKTRRQLYSLGLLPDNMGGEVPFVETSAVTGQGVGELLDAIGIVAELADLKADPTHPGSGTCLEAYLEGDRGVVATLLVQQGTLKKGDVIICGATYGRVRAMYNDMGLAIEEAPPSTPVKVIGLSDVPDADDPFYFVDELSTAREIAEKRRSKVQEAALNKFTPVSLDSLKENQTKVKISELKIILKAEARGSVEAIRKELEKLIHEEVRCKVLHAGIGAINESDVTLALTSPEDTLIIGFNVTADDPALRLAEERSISLREYQIIYNLVDDVKAALEGRLKPIEEVVHLGRAVVRDTFKISKVGTIAGCYVTSGIIERNSKIRVIRQGTVIAPAPEKTLGLDSLKRFKDDAKEVREGFECGMKITGFDDIKVDDVIEAYRIESRTRTL